MTSHRPRNEMPQYEAAPQWQHGTTLPPQYNTMYPTPDVQTVAAAPDQEVDMFNADGTFK